MIIDMGVTIALFILIWLGNYANETIYEYIDEKILLVARVVDTRTDELDEAKHEIELLRERISDIENKLKPEPESRYDYY